MIERYRGFVLDIDGVIVRGGRLLPGALAATRRLRSLGKLVFLTNNSTKPAKAVAGRLTELGIPVLEEEVVTSSWIAGTYLHSCGGPSAVWVIGEPGLEEELTRIGHHLADPDEAEWVVAGMDRGISYDRLTSALRALRNGALLLATNTDPTFPGEHGESPGAGATIGALAGMGYRPNRIAGKPERMAFDLALERLGMKRSEVLVIGDRLETDIRGAANAEMDSSLVLTGVTTTAMLSETSVRPTWVCSSLETLSMDQARSGALEREDVRGDKRWSARDDAAQDTGSG
ncbi:HAD-IIA family hydrolase [Candidatus Bipolaricaulota bacterium]|nr:HAD-IIA family hydrolase [Candidatus Bipolaricaulota bacterium]